LPSQWFTGKDAGIVTDSNFGQADPLMNVTTHQLKERIEPLLEKGVVPVVSGYIAATQEGVVTTSVEAGLTTQRLFSVLPYKLMRFGSGRMWMD